MHNIFLNKWEEDFSISIMFLSQVEWQSEQEKKESKSIYHSEKEDSYIPIIPKDIEGSHVDIKSEEREPVGSKIDVNKVLSTNKSTKTDNNSPSVVDKEKS